MGAPVYTIATLNAHAKMPVGPSDFRGVLSAGAGIPEGESRWYRIQALDGALAVLTKRKTPWSDEIGPFTAASPNNRVTLNWTAVSGAVGYKIFVRTSTNPNPTYSYTIPNMLGAAAFTSWNSAGAVATLTDSLAVPVCKRPVFENGWISVVITGGDSGTPASFRGLYDAIIAAGYTSNAALLLPSTMLREITGNYFSLCGYFQIGDNSTVTYFESKDSCVFLAGRIVSLGTNATFILGEYDAVSGRRSRGCSIYAIGHGTTSDGAAGSGTRLQLWGNDRCDFNDSYVEDLARRGVAFPSGNSNHGLGFDGSMRLGDDATSSLANIRGSEIAGTSLTISSPGHLFTGIDVEDVFVRSCFAAFFGSAKDISGKNVTSEGCTIGVWAKVLNNNGYPSTIRLINLRVRGRITTDLRWYAIVGSPATAVPQYLRDPDFNDAVDNEDPIVEFIQATTGSTLQYEGLHDFLVVRGDGSKVSGATLTILDAAGTALVSGVTDATGKVPGGLLCSHLIFTYTSGTLFNAPPQLLSALVAGGNFTKTDRRPFTLVVTHGEALLESARLPFSPTGSVSSIVVLHPDGTLSLGTSVVEPLAVAATVAPISLVCSAAMLDADAEAGAVIPLVGDFD